MQINMETSALGIAGPVSLPPGTFRFGSGSTSGISLSEILGYSIVSEPNRTCGLRLVGMGTGDIARCDACQRSGITRRQEWALLSMTVPNCIQFLSVSA